MKREGIIVKHDSPSVSNYLIEAPEAHGSHETPASPFNPLDEVDDHGDAKEGDEGRIGGHRRAVFIQAPLDGTKLKRAIGAGTVGDEIVPVRHVAEFVLQQRSQRDISDESATGTLGEGEGGQL